MGFETWYSGDKSATVAVDTRADEQSKSPPTCDLHSSRDCTATTYIPPPWHGGSPSKRAVWIMNLTSGLCADPFHLHSFKTVGGGWVPTPKSLFVGAFQKCSFCNGRLGGSAAPSLDDGSGDSAEAMLQCVACGAYAHRSCAFMTSRCSGDLAAVCKVNSAKLTEAINSKKRCKRMQKAVSEEEINGTSWAVDGKTIKVGTKRDPNENRTPSSVDEEHDPIDCALLEKRAQITEGNQTKGPQAHPGVIETIQTSFKLVDKVNESTWMLPRASAIGMVTGGVAGLVFAGPAGMAIGSQIGRTVVTVGAVVESGVGIGVLAMSLAAAANYTISSAGASGHERRLKLSDDDSIVLIRPDVAVDPVWGQFAEEARRSWEEKTKESDRNSSWGGIGNLFKSPATTAEATKDERDKRYGKDSDIIRADSAELGTNEKVFLLATRILNDKMSLPGFVYRYLILKHKRRTMFDEGSVETRLSLSGLPDIAVEAPSPRSCKRDAHGVIKHVTASLIEVRPGLAATPALTEMSASAVEALVFGELYGEVFGEIASQTEAEDDGLARKAEGRRARRGGVATGPDDGAGGPSAGGASVSARAVEALNLLPSAHTPTGKLLHCVDFLERVSAHFSARFAGRVVDADALLAMVCQHVVAADVARPHAEVSFIEEFSRDGQLLSGKAGYALITLKASLHYLDSLDDFARLSSE